MGNMISITDRNGNEIGVSSHSLVCAAYVDEVCKQYNPKFTLWGNPSTLNERLEEIYKVCSPEDELILLIFINDESNFDEDNIPAFNKAIEKLKDGNRIHETIKKHLISYLVVLKEHKYIKTKYVGVCSSITIGKE